MAVSGVVANFLESHSIAFESIAIDAAESIDAERWLRAVLFRETKNVLLVVVPKDNFLDIEVLCSATGKKLAPVYPETIGEVVPGHDALNAVLVPLGALYGVRTLLHQSIPRDGTLYFTDRDGESVLGVAAQDLIAAQRDLSQADIAFPVTDEMIKRHRDQHEFMRKRIDALLEDVEGLPAMPQMAQRILQVTGDPSAAAIDLAKVIEVDPSLSAQIISYATSAFYGYRGDITSVREAISRVLGFELVANIALGIAIGTSFKVPAEGPIGLSAFWRHAVYASALAERLCKIVPRDRLARPAMAYLSALLHDFGYLVLGHIMPQAFQQLNQAIAANSTLKISTLENMILGMSHTEIGPRLLQQWKLPDEAVIAAQWHHAAEYRDEFAVYPQLIAVAEHLLHQHGVGSDADIGPLPRFTLSLLGVDESAVERAAQPVIDACAELDSLSQLLSNAA